MNLEFISLDSFQAAKCLSTYHLLSSNRRIALDRLSPDDRKRSLAGEWLARKMLAQYLKVSPSSISFTYSHNGKPLTTGAHFSISHSGKLVACAVDDQPVGLDLECRTSADLRLATSICTPDELVALTQLPRIKQGTHLLKLWTLKEARIKCLDTTLIDLNGASFFLTPEGQVHCSDNRLQCSLHLTHPGCTAAVCRLSPLQIENTR